MGYAGNPGCFLWTRCGRRSQGGTLQKVGSLSGLESGMKRRGRKCRGWEGTASSEGWRACGRAELRNETQSWCGPDSCGTVDRGCWAGAGGTVQCPQERLPFWCGRESGGGWCERNRGGEEQKDRTLSSQRPEEDQELAGCRGGRTEKFFGEWELKFGLTKQALVNTRILYFWEKILTVFSFSFLKGWW